MNILDMPVPKNFNAPVLKPTPYEQDIIPKLKELALNASEKVRKRINKFAAWIINYIPSPMKVKSVKTALKGFTKSYEIDIISNDPLKQIKHFKKTCKRPIAFTFKEVEWCENFIHFKNLF